MAKNTDTLSPAKLIDKESIDLWFEPENAFEEDKWTRIPHFVHTIATFSRGGVATLLSATLAPAEWLEIPVMPGGNLRMIRSFSEALRACNGELQHDSQYWQWVVRGATKAWACSLEDFLGKRFSHGAFEVVGNRSQASLDDVAFFSEQKMDWPGLVGRIYKQSRLLELNRHYFLEAFYGNELFVDGSDLGFRLTGPDAGENDPLAWRRQAELLVFSWACRKVMNTGRNWGLKRDEKTIIRTLTNIPANSPSLRWPFIEKEVARQVGNTQSFFNQSNTPKEGIPAVTSRVLRKLQSTVEKKNLLSLRNSVTGDEGGGTKPRGGLRRHL